MMCRARVRVRARACAQALGAQRDPPIISPTAFGPLTIPPTVAAAAGATRALLSRAGRIAAHLVRVRAKVKVRVRVRARVRVRLRVRV